MNSSEEMVLEAARQSTKPLLTMRLGSFHLVFLTICAALNGAAVVGSATAATLQQLGLHKIALSDELPLQEQGGGSLARFVDRPSIDDNGNVAFAATMGKGSMASSVWKSTGSQLRLVTQAGDPAPNTAAAFAHFSDIMLANDGMIGFGATLVGKSIDDRNSESIWLDRASTLMLVAQTGQKAPNPVTDLRFSHFETRFALGRNEQFTFFARTRDKDGDSAQGSGIWITGSNDISLAASESTAAIAGEPAVLFLPQSFEQPFANDPAISPSGQAIFRGFLAGPGVDESNLNGLWSYSESSGLQLLQRAGDAAEQHGTFLSFPSTPTINSRGDTAFLAFCRMTDDHHGAITAIPAASDHPEPAELGLGLWLRTESGELTNIFAIGDHAPGMVGDAHFVDTFDPILNASSSVAFVAVVAGTGIGTANEVGLWSNGMSTDGGLRLVTRQGDEAPGSEQGFVFGTFLEPSLNAAGQTAFMAAGYKLDNDVPIDSAFGIWGQDRAGVLRLVAKVGQLLEVAPGDEREIASLAFASKTGGEDGRSRGLNDLGLLAFQAAFTDGSTGVFVSYALTIPEPNSEAMLVLAATCVGLHRRWNLVVDNRTSQKTGPTQWLGRP